MIIHAITYKGVDLSDSRANHFTIQSSQKEVDLSTRIDNLTNYHGSNAYATVAGGRLFTFTGKIFGASKGDRMIGQNLLNAIICPEGQLENSPDYPLTWTDDGGVAYRTLARVYKMPVYTHEVASDILDFHFELYSDLPYVTSATANTATITLGQYGGALFTNDSVGVFLGTTQLNSATNVLKVTNTGNFQTGLIFTLSSPVPSLTITNVTNGTKYTLPSPLYNLSYDSTTRPSTVISNGTDYSGYRAVGSTTVTLSPGDNYIRFGADASADWTGYADPATITASLSWYNAYINS